MNTLEQPECSGVRAGLDFVRDALAALALEAAQAKPTPLFQLRLPRMPGIVLLLKDESAHPSGSLKHRLARELLHDALRDGRLDRRRGLVDASSGSTAISEAWFAQRLGLPYCAVMPDGTAPRKIRAVHDLAGECVLVGPRVDARRHAAVLARKLDACFLDQFGHAGRMQPMPGVRDLAGEVLSEIAARGLPPAAWFVCGAGTGGTSSTIGRRLRAEGGAARLCVAEPEGTAFARGFRHREEPCCAPSSLIEGVGRARIEPGFAFERVDRVVEIADETAIAACWLLAERIGRRYGGSSGLDLAAALVLAGELHAHASRASIVVVLGDDGNRYAETIYDRRWLATNGIAIDAARQRLRRHFERAAA